LLLYELRPLRPPLLEEHGLASALRARLQSVETRAGLKVALECEGDTRLNADQEQELYRLAQEALNNVVKHARATGVRVRLDLSGNPSVLEVCHDGSGFEPSAVDRAGYGLRGMHERAERLGATLQVVSAPGAGTRVSVAVPR